MESISGKASLLAEIQTYLGSAGGWKTGFARYPAATPQQLQDAGRKWLSDGDYVLRILPFGDLAAHGVDADRSAVPTPAGVVPATFPKVERAQLSNGMTRSEEHTSELQSLMRISYAVFCLKKKKKTQITTHKS